MIEVGFKEGFNMTLRKLETVLLTMKK